MCTVVVSVDPSAEVPVLLAGVRDEFVDRRWRPPSAHWAGWPGLLGGLDLQAGGTWLAVDPDVPRVAAVLNGKGSPAPQDGRRSRGELPLLGAERGDMDLKDSELPSFDPFHLVLAEPDGARLWSWDGDRLVVAAMTPGLHMITSTGLDRADDQARVAYFLPRFRAAPRPTPSSGQARESAWGEWLPLVDGDGVDPSDPRAMVMRRRASDRAWASTSTTLVALAPGGVRYDFSARPGDADAWETVLDRL
ncbi:MAG: hypothetical protein GEV03_02090 [Streptosporangiales bacterium]|nr:hypothetical protein [Streptosporangiales bacterium]